jgi:Spy/CpxP family protein refolding chaperone
VRAGWPTVALCSLACGVLGFVLGRETRERPGARAPTRRDDVRLPVETGPAAPEAPSPKNAGPAPEQPVTDGPAETPAAEEIPGTRRDDGTIVGGATWTPVTRLLAVGFLEDQVSMFFADANLTEYQKQQLKAEMEQRITDLMQLAADHANGEIDADQVYESVEALAATTRKNVAQLLDEKQIVKMDEFERGMVQFNRNNIVSNEMTTLRQELKLDPEQERLIRPIVEERYRRVQDRISTPIPNFMFKPIRRKADATIYEETSKAMRQYLRPEQRAAFDAADAAMATAIYGFRPSLVPK